MTEQELLVDCLERLNRCGVSYMLTGSMASNYWGIPRTTHDLDFVVRLQRESIEGIVREFADEYFIQQSSVEAALMPPHQFNAIDTRSSLKIDFWTLTNDPFEQEMFSRRCSVTLFGASAFVATAEDVLLHKLVWNRTTSSERQVHDAAGIWAVQRDALNMPYLQKWANRLDVSDTFNSIVRGEIHPKHT